MANVGAVPVDGTTLLGQVRSLIGDTQYKDLIPAQTGFGDFGYFSDSDILAFIGTGLPNAKRAAGNAFLQLAVSTSLSSVNMATDDLRIANDKRAADIRLAASMYFAQADDDDAHGRNGDAEMIIVSPGRKLTVFSPWRNPLLDDYYGLDTQTFTAKPV
ncbi:hypothetical protein [Frigoribacterium sp. UYMn621]|uniref:hypothetical protein n=1 Tax=Frigoribacterium sp. UYMn621 TaxID=3156343 RepID=UPI003392E024